MDLIVPHVVPTSLMRFGLPSGYHADYFGSDRVKAERQGVIGHAEHAALFGVVKAAIRRARSRKRP